MHVLHSNHFPVSQVSNLNIVVTNLVPQFVVWIDELEWSFDILAAVVIFQLFNFMQFVI